MDLTQLVTVADRITSWIDDLRKGDAVSRARWRDAVACLQEAVIQTQLYVAALERGSPLNRSTEGELALKWQEAAAAFCGVDGELAERLQLKGEYWTMPDIWTEQQVRDANISLQHVAEHPRQLLHESR